MAQDASGPIKVQPRPSYVATKRKKNENCCECPACRGLECLERPRYFAGQLLTEAELNSEQAYVLAKNRLHNRYLHGWGIVCGLDVVCHNCSGWVRVHAGYALDPCGNDVIVCRDTDFNVLEAIQKCIDAKSRRDDDCPPWRDPNDHCKEDDQHWCITLQYVENEARAVMPLMESKSHCGCGGKSNCGGGCDCGGSKKSAHGSSGGGCGCGGDKPKATPKKVACEPTRIFEQYRLGVVPEPESCARTRKLGGAEPIEIRGELVNALPADLAKHPLFAALLAAAPDESILRRALAVVQDVLQFLETRLTKEELQQLIAAFRLCRSQSNGDANAAGTNDALYALCCKLRRVVADLYASNPHNVRCVPFDCGPCQQSPTPPPPPPPPPPGATTPPNPGASVPGGQDLGAICCLIDALQSYVADALCMLLLPPCPPQACDDRIILACVTIKGGKIVHICNHSCRHYAGSFNSVEYWLSAVPVIPFIGKLLRELCCSEQLIETFTNVKKLFDGEKV